MATPSSQSKEIAKLIAASRSHSDSIDLLFRHYTALAHIEDREAFVLALVAEVATLRAMKVSKLAGVCASAKKST